MKHFCAVLMSALALVGLSAAQDVSANADQDSQSIVAAAQASKTKAAVAASKEADIRRLMALTGAAGLASQAMDGMEQNLRPLITNSLPAGDYRDKLVDLFFEKFRAKRDLNQLVDLIVPIYDKYYTAEEVRQLIDFYQTPLGKKMLTVLPKIMAESQAAGGEWGQELGKQCMMEVLQEHPEMRQAILQAKGNSTR